MMQENVLLPDESSAIFACSYEMTDIYYVYNVH